MSDTSKEPDRDEVEQAADAGDAAVSPRERRLTLRAYDYWSRAGGDKKLPGLKDLDPEGLAPFRDNSFLIDFKDGDYLEAVFRHVGAAIEAETGAVTKGTPIRNVPQGSVLDRLADYYLQAVAHEAPVGFDAEFERDDGMEVLYRGILLPLSDDGERIDLLLGVLSWKVATPEEAAAIRARRDGEEAPPADVAATSKSSETTLAGVETEGLQALLAASRSAAEEAKILEGRSHEALYRALARAYGFHLASRAEPEAYGAMLRGAGLKVQERAPFTPLIKLVFGAEYDKARITEYAAALAHLQRLGVTAEQAEDFIAAFEGGLKGLVAAERAARRAVQGEAVDDRTAEARRRLAGMRRLDWDEAGVVAPGEGDYVLLLARRKDESRVEPVAVLDHSEAAIDAAVRRAAARVDSGAGEKGSAAEEAEEGA